MKSHLRCHKWWQIGLSLGLCVILVMLLDFEEVRILLARADLRWIFLALALMQADRLLMAYKWNLLFECTNLQVPQSLAIQAYYVGSLWSCFLPFAGGDVIRNIWLFQRIGAGTHIASTIVIERLYGFLALALVAFASLIMGMMYFRVQSEFIPLVGMIILLLIMSFSAIKLLFNQSFHNFIDHILERIPFPKFSEILKKLRMSILLFKEKSRTLQIFLVLSILEIFFPVMVLYLLIQAFSLDLSFVWAMIGMPIILAISRVPISMDGLGLTEGAYVFILSLGGLSVSEAIIIAVMGRMLVIISALPGILFSSSIGSLLRAEPVVSSDATISKKHGH